MSTERAGPVDDDVLVSATKSPRTELGVRQVAEATPVHAPQVAR
jgi:hypothetical protein